MDVKDNLKNYLLFNNANSNRSFKGGVPMILVLLDSQSTINVFCYKDLLVNIHEVQAICTSDVML